MSPSSSPSKGSVNPSSLPSSTPSKSPIPEPTMLPTNFLQESVFIPGNLKIIYSADKLRKRNDHPLDSQFDPFVPLKHLSQQRFSVNNPRFISIKVGSQNINNTSELLLPNSDDIVQGFVRVLPGLKPRNVHVDNNNTSSISDAQFYATFNWTLNYIAAQTRFRTGEESYSAYKILMQAAASEGDLGRIFAVESDHQWLLNAKYIISFGSPQYRHIRSARPSLQPTSVSSNVPVQLTSSDNQGVEKTSNALIGSVVVVSVVISAMMMGYYIRRNYPEKFDSLFHRSIVVKKQDTPGDNIELQYDSIEREKADLYDVYDHNLNRFLDEEKYDGILEHTGAFATEGKNRGKNIFSFDNVFRESLLSTPVTPINPRNPPSFEASTSTNEASTPPTRIEIKQQEVTLLAMLCNIHYMMHAYVIMKYHVLSRYFAIFNDRTRLNNK